MTHELAYDWNGAIVRVDVYDARNGGEWDVSSTWPEHDTGIVPAGEIHYCCQPYLADGNAGWWCDRETFAKYAVPVSPGAHDHEQEFPDE